MKALLRAILSHRREMSAVADCAGHPCPMGGVQEALERVTREALSLPHVDAWLAWVEAVERTEQAAWLASKDGHFDDVPRAIAGEEVRERVALARLRVAVAGQWRKP